MIRSGWLISWAAAKLVFAPVAMVIVVAIAAAARERRRLLKTRNLLATRIIK
jgi:hypothetical protein